MINCAVCKTGLENLADTFGGVGYQPSGGTAFKSYGHYGSGSFDPMDGSYVEICLCDGCFEDLGCRGFMFKNYQPAYQAEVDGSYDH